MALVTRSSLVAGEVDDWRIECGAGGDLYERRGGVRGGPSPEQTGPAARKHCSGTPSSASRRAVSLHVSGPA
jgi:hypothetical protein